MSILSQQKQSQNTDFPNVRPSLDLRFALAKKLDPRITFTRGSTGTYFGPDGLMRTADVNEPRFDHDPVTGQSLGLFIEESRTNLALQSESINSSPWGTSTLTIASNIITAPDGNLTADKLIENPSFSSFKTTAQSVGTISGDYTISAFFKAGERYKGYIQLLSGGGNAAIFFDLKAGTITGGAGTRTITSYGNGWYRVSSSVTFTSASASIYIVVLRDDGTSAYTGDGTSGLYCWGVQVEAGAFQTSYIPTSGSTVTRSVDTATMTGTNFSSWYNQTEGTFFTDVKSSTSFTSATNACSFGIFGASNNTVLANYHSLSSVWIFRNSARSNNAFFNVSMNVSSNRKSIATYRTGPPDYYTAAFGGSSLRDSTTIAGASNPRTGTLRTDQVYFELNPSRLGLVCLNGTISRLTYYPIQLTNQQLINLTS